MMKKMVKKIIIIFTVVITAFNFVGYYLKKKSEKDKDLYEDCYEGAGESVLSTKQTLYEAHVKRMIDVVLASIGLVVLSPVFLVTAIAIFITDPGPVIFTQKRVGLNKTYFKLYKFRSMLLSTPHDMPTHMLENPDSYITSVGRFIRKTSIDELPQLINILKGDISIVGPRPALWNQEDLVAEREKYGANDVMPGLTGWAQINGRDELEIPDKARLDGDYVEKLRKNSLSGLTMDVRCFLGTVSSVLKSDGVVEGGTGEMKRNARYDIPDTDTTIGFGEPVEIDFSQVKKVLITGANSYIGETFEQYANEHYEANFEIDTVDMIDGSWRDKDFSGYDTVFHVAGIAHADVGNVSDEVKDKYYAVNTDLAIETAKKAREDGVKQFVFMSSMIVYGDSAPYGKDKMITAETKPEPANFYGDSKWQADKGVRALATDNFKVLVLRPPMIYGKGSKGNYPTLAKLAKKLPIFPDVNNQRSMLYVENLCEFLCQVMLVGKGGIFFPQNAEYSKTTDMVKEICNVTGKKIWVTKALNPFVWIGSKMPGKIGRLVNKAFGSNCYDFCMSQYDTIKYNDNSFAESIRETEGSEKIRGNNILIVASVASMIDQFNMDNISILKELGYNVDVACNFQNGSTCSTERIEILKKRLMELDVKYYQVDFSRDVLNIKKDFIAYSQLMKIVREKDYDIMHCHSPIGGVIGRIVAHKRKITALYTAHGFHFFEGGPKKNWILYYPIEYLLSFWTDILFTINNEDYLLANRKFHMKKIVALPGVGVNIERFCNNKIDVKKKREELGIPEDAFVCLSVGELQDRKNHRTVIEAVKKLADKEIYYLIVGTGMLYDEYLQLINEYNYSENIKLLGFRTDIEELCFMSNCFIHPSIREGLGIAPLEAKASGLPLISSYVNGIKDYTSEGQSGCCINNPNNVDEMLQAIVMVKNNIDFRVRCGNNNKKVAKKYDIKETNAIMRKVYEGVKNDLF